jgi:hypothetical protein
MVGGVASNGFTFTVNTTPLLTGFSPGASGAPDHVFVGTKKDNSAMREINDLQAIET